LFWGKEYMAKELRCRDLGFDCDQVIQGEAEEEVVAKAATHALLVHRVEVIDEKILEQIRTVIRTV
jgi:predicted small metal-binding protein